MLFFVVITIDFLIIFEKYKFFGNTATEGLVQQAFGKIANFVVNTRLLLARNFIFDRK
jgi:hypothetical protein